MSSSRAHCSLGYTELPLLKGRKQRYRVYLGPLRGPGPFPAYESTMPGEIPLFTPSSGRRLSSCSPDRYMMTSLHHNKYPGRQASLQTLASVTTEII
ncbi:hypothetical protein CEXT_712641 [Caerostris extrusa]|uniref:Uncharacterized protein n=1 Tax=Caerostris extrusa TaxID=172846 RepID=A0AAV4WV69_CAEEX|nr:hypothetical protein CEXT_712641 [Caerostris extrusa]